MDDLKRVIKIQAYFRGTLVRKWFRDVRKTYEDLAQELEKNPSTHITWPNERLCHPKVEKLSKKKTMLTQDTDKTEKVLKTTCIYNDNLSPHEQNEAEAERLHQEKTLNNCLQETESSERICFREEIAHEIPVKFDFISVETQTKFSCDEESTKSPSEKLDFYPVKNCKLIQTEAPTNFYDDTEFHQQAQVTRFNTRFTDLNHSNSKSIAEGSHSLPLNTDKINVMQKMDIILDKRPVSPVQINHGSKDSSRTKSPTIIPRNKHQSGGFHATDPSNISAFTNVTSLWESFNSLQDSVINHRPSLPQDVNELQEMRKSIAMELLWVQQAIHSRKSYLRLKHEMKDSVTG